MIYVTHDQEEALAMSDWIAVMNHGRVVQYGTPWQIYYRPRSTFMADFVGAVNLVKARLIAKHDGDATIDIEGQQLTVPRDTSATSLSNEVILSIRPESLSLSSEPPTDPALVVLRASVVRHIFLGHLMRYWVLAADQQWVVDRPDPGASDILEGTVYLGINPGRAHLIEETDSPAL
jgi:ABC-type Fe3+/spermidine/putrescine transport system ATPase subunit